jgi:fatty-acyl-CoA synthase
MAPRTSDQPPALHPADILEAISDAIPDAPALIWRDTTRTWREFEDRAARLAHAFQAAGLKPGSAVALYLHNSPAYIEAYLATLKMRGVPINTNYRYQAEELEYLLDNADAEAIVFDEETAPRIAALAGKLGRLKIMVEAGPQLTVSGAQRLDEIVASHPPAVRIERSPDDLNMSYTGGTTGLPKGVRNTVGKITRGIMNIAAGALGASAPHSAAEAAEQARAFHEEGRSPVSVVAPPFMHPTGLCYGALVPLMSGGSVVMLPSWSFSAVEMLRTIAQHRATSATIAGEVMAGPIASALEEMAATGQAPDISCLKAMYSSGMIWSARSKTVILEHARDALLIDVVGSTEGHVGTSYARRGAVPDTGVFTPNPTTKVLTPDGREVAPGSGEAGLLACAGDITGSGYHKDPAKSEKTYKTINGVKYVIAGDWATVEADGSIRFIGRDSSCINTGGEKVYAEEVENLIVRMPQVIDCIVVGVPDARWGQVVGAVVTPAPDARLDAATIQQWVRAGLAGYKVPRRIVIGRAPRAPNGKADLSGARDILVKAGSALDAVAS